MNRQLIRTMRNALDACRELDRRGFHVQEVEIDATCRLPLVTIAEPSPGAVETFAVYRRNGAPIGTTLIAGVSVQWVATDSDARRVA